MLVGDGSARGMRDAFSQLMPQRPRNDAETSKRRSTDRGGLGQSGYTAGRHATDSAHGIPSRNQERDGEDDARAPDDVGAADDPQR